MTTIDGIPEELLVEIFSYLPSEDRKNCRLVSRKWQRIAFTESLTKDQWLVLNTMEIDRKLSPVSRYSNVRLERSLCVADIRFVRNHGSFIRKLHLNSIRASNYAFTKLMKSVPNVVEVNLEGCNFFDDKKKRKRPAPSVSLLQLEQLQILLTPGYEDLWNEEIDAAFVDTPNLIDLNVFVEGRFTYSCYRSRAFAFLTESEGKIIMPLIKRQANIMKKLSLNIRHTTATDIVQLVGPQLIELHLLLDRAQYPQSDLLLSAISKYVNLQYFSLANATPTAQSLASLIGHMPKLKEIHFKWVEVSGHPRPFWKAIDNLAELKTLKIIPKWERLPPLQLS